MLHRASWCFRPTQSITVIGNIIHALELCWPYGSTIRVSVSILNGKYRRNLLGISCTDMELLQLMRRDGRLVV